MQQTQWSSVKKLKPIKEYIQNKCILPRDFTPNIPINKSDNSINNKFELGKLILDPELWAVVAEYFWETHSAQYPFQLAGLELNGSIAASLISNHLFTKHEITINTFLIRNKRKKYSTCELIEGEILNLPIIIIDETINSLSSIFSAISKLLKEKPSVIISEVFAIIDINETRIKDSITFKINTLFSKSDFKVLYPPKAENFKSVFPKINWIFSSPNPHLLYAIPKSAPLLYKNSILFGSESGFFWCLDKNTGKVKWKFNAHTINRKGIISSAFLDKNRLYFGDYSGFLHSLDVDTGTPVFSIKLCDWIGSSPTIVGNRLIIGCEYKKSPNGAVVCVNLDTLKTEWTVPTNIYLHGSPIYSKDHNVILIGTNDSTLLVINIDTGVVIRSIQTDGSIKYQPATQGSLCVFGSFDGGIYIWDFIANKIINKIQTQDIVYSRPLIYQNKIFMGSADSDFYILDLLTGRILNKINCKEKVHCSPSVINNYVYCGVSNGNLIKINPSSLEIEKIVHFPERLVNAVIADDNNMFVYDFTNTMYATELE